MARHRREDPSYFDPRDLEPEFNPKDVSEPVDTGFDPRDLELEFRPKDVSEPKDTGFDPHDLELEFNPKDVSEPKETDFDPHGLDVDFEPEDVSEPIDTGFIPQTLEDDEFHAADVSEPRDPRKEIEIIEEALAIRRRDWFKTHMSYIYAVIGVLIVGLVIFGIYMLYRNSNPMSRLIHSASKDFGTSFNYEIQLSEDGQPVMSYDGSITVDRSKHAIQAVYDADYNTYSYTGALYADDGVAVKGSKYDGKWSVHDAADNVKDFFDFDQDFRSDRFDGGAFLRFTGLTSKYSTGELERIVEVFKQRLSTDSSIAEVTSKRGGGGTKYHYDIDVYNLFESIDQDGASVFFRSTDYDKFHAAFEQNKSVIRNAKCTVEFTVSASGYLTFFEALITVEGREFGMTCKMSDFGSAKVDIPQDFMKAALIPDSEKE